MMVLIDWLYNASQEVTWAKCIYMGDQINPNDPFSWEKVVLNLPRT